VLSNLTKTEDGQRGMTMRVYLEPASNPNRTPIDTVYLDNTEMYLSDYKHPQLTSHTWYTEVTGLLTPDSSGEHIFSLSVAGTATLSINDQLVVDNAHDQTRGDSFFGSGTDEKTGHIHLEAGQTYTVLVRHGTLPTSPLLYNSSVGAGGLRIGGMRKLDDKTELDRAVALAKSVDQVVICAGLNVSSPLRPPLHPEIQHP
jgi:beta-glucosidase